MNPKMKHKTLGEDGGREGSIPEMRKVASCDSSNCGVNFEYEWVNLCLGPFAGETCPAAAGFWMQRVKSHHATWFKSHTVHRAVWQTDMSGGEGPLCPAIQQRTPLDDAICMQARARVHRLHTAVRLYTFPSLYYFCFGMRRCFISHTFGVDVHLLAVRQAFRASPAAPYLCVNVCMCVSVCVCVCLSSTSSPATVCRTSSPVCFSSAWLHHSLPKFSNVFPHPSFHRCDKWKQKARTKLVYVCVARLKNKTKQTAASLFSLGL